MHRILLHLPVPGVDGGVPIYSYGFMLMIGFVAALWLAARRAPRFGMNRDQVYDLGLLMIISGIVGARAAFVFIEMEEPLQSLGQALAIWQGGLVFQGGLLLALVATVVYLRWKKLSISAAADVYAPGLALGVAFGRIGCFLNGCCWGRLCHPEFPLGVRFPVTGQFPHEPPMLQNVNHFYYYQPEALARAAEAAGIDPSAVSFPLSVHPAQLYSAAALLAITLLLLWIDGRRGGPGFASYKPAPEGEGLRLPRPGGVVMLSFFILYSVFRFFVEFVRDDTPLHVLVEGLPALRMGQILALATLAGSALVLLWLRRRERRNAPPPGESS